MPHLKNIKGNRYGAVVVLEQLDSRYSDGSVEWKCVCDCGREFKMSGTRLRADEIKHCGCNGRKRHEFRTLDRTVQLSPLRQKAASVQDFICHHKPTGESEMSAYIFCPKCREDSLDVDTLCCDCGYSPNQRIRDLEQQLAAAEEMYRGVRSFLEETSTDEENRLRKELAAAQEKIVAQQAVLFDLVTQIERNDFVDSHGHEAKMLKALFDARDDLSALRAHDAEVAAKAIEDFIFQFGDEDFPPRLVDDARVKAAEYREKSK